MPFSTSRMPARFTSARCRVPGGLAVLAGIGISVALGARDVWLPVAAAAVLAAVSFADDLRGLATSLRFAAHLGVAAALLWYFLAPADAMLIALLSVAVAWLALLVFAPFIADATITLARRALRREAVWRAHRQHYYQRCVRMGFGHARTALGAYVLMLGCAAAALYGRGQPPAQQATALLCA